MSTDAPTDLTLDVLSNLADTTFLLLHLIEKGYRTDDAVTVTRFALEDAIAVLRDRGVTLAGCQSCGSRHPESSPWHLNHCIDTVQEQE